MMSETEWRMKKFSYRNVYTHTQHTAEYMCNNLLTWLDEKIYNEKMRNAKGVKKSDEENELDGGG